MHGVQGAEVTPASLRKHSLTSGRRGRELTARDFLAALEDPTNFADPGTLKRYLASSINRQGKELGDDGIGWFEQVGWIEGVKKGWTQVKMWQGRRAMFVWSAGAWRVACLPDSIPLTRPEDLEHAPSHARSPGWPRYRS